jgi:hypothetical protein
MNLISDTADNLLYEGPGDALSLLQDINETFLVLLIESARQPTNGGEFFLALRETFCRMDESAKATVASAPLLLLDFEFRNADWWKGVASDPRRRFLARRPLIEQEQAIELTRGALMLAWHLARSDLASCLVLVGLSDPVAQVVRSLRPKQIDLIAEHQFRSMRPRWEDRPYLWQQLLTNIETDIDLRAFAIRALRLSWTRTQAPA